MAYISCARVQNFQGSNKLNLNVSDYRYVHYLWLYGT